MLAVDSNMINGNLTTSNYKRETNRLNSLKESLLNTDDKKDKQLLKAAQDFEAVFINQILQIMDKTVQRSKFMHGGQGEKIFREMFYQEIAKEIASNKATSFGLGKQIYEQLSRYE